MKELCATKRQKYFCSFFHFSERSNESYAYPLDMFDIAETLHLGFPRGDRLILDGIDRRTTKQSHGNYLLTPVPIGQSILPYREEELSKASMEYPTLPHNIYENLDSNFHFLP